MKLLFKAMENGQMKLHMNILLIIYIYSNNCYSFSYKISSRSNVILAFYCLFTLIHSNTLLLTTIIMLPGNSHQVVPVGVVVRIWHRCGLDSIPNQGT